MTINKNLLFSLLLALITVFTGLNLFSINTFHVNTIYSFLYLITVPGLLIYLIIQPRIDDFWERLCIVVGLSISFIMFAGLGINWVLPLLGISNPLSTTPLTLAFSTLNAVLLLNAYVRSEFKYKIHFKKISSLNVWFFLVPIIFPIFAVMGATSLNNGGSNFFTLYALIGIPIYITLLCIFNTKLNKNIYPFSIYCIGLAILLSLSLRGWHVSGTDIIQEFRIFSNTYVNQFWEKNYYHSYNACLSLTVLPSVFNSFMQTNNEYIFKFYMQVIYAFAPMMVYLFTRKYINNYFAFAGTIIYMSFPIFVESMVMHIRQEMAFLFFSLMLLTLFYKKSKKFLMLSIVFGISLVVSHYSSAYIAIILAGFTYALRITVKLILYVINRIKKKDKQNSIKYISDNNLNIILIITLVLSTFLWYSVINKSSDNFTSYIKNFSKNIDSKMMRRENMTPINQFNVNYKAEDPTKIFNSYLGDMQAEKEEDDKLYYPNSTLSQFSPTIIRSYTTPLKVEYSIYQTTNLTMEYIKKIMKVLFVIGIVYLVVTKFKKLNENTDYYLLLISSVGLILIFTLLPSISLDYDISRTFQQLLSFAIYPIILGALFLFRYFNKSLIRYLFTIFVILYFCTYTHIFQYVTGNYSPIDQLDLTANRYSTGILHDSEVYSLKWLDANFISYAKIHLDDVAATKRTYVSPSDFFIINDNVPTSIQKNNYVYLDYTNVKNNTVYKIIHGNYILYTYPFSFLDINKDSVYSNGENKIYK